MEKVSLWLRSIGLDQYVVLFADKGYDDPLVVAELNDEDLDNIGIIVPGNNYIKKSFRK